jgi:two-component system chemotaxis response regulator CheY
MALKAVLIDGNGVARGMLNTVLCDGGYEVCGLSHASGPGLALVQKHHPQLVCIARAQAEDGNEVIKSIRASCPKTIIFIVAGGIDAAMVQAAQAGGVSGFIVQPFNADAVLRTIRTTLLAVVRKQQGASPT